MLELKISKNQLPRISRMYGNLNRFNRIRVQNELGFTTLKGEKKHMRSAVTTSPQVCNDYERGAEHGSSLFLIRPIKNVFFLGKEGPCAR